MLVPRSYKYSSGAAADGHGDARSSKRLSSRKPNSSGSPSTSGRSSPVSSRQPSPQRTPTSTTTPVTEPVAIPSTIRSSNAQASGPSASTSTTSTRTTSTMPSYKSATYHGGRRKPSAHDPNALPPSVAALLAVTAIPPRRRNRYRGKSGSERRISIEELVRDWKSDESLKSSYGSSPALNVLLEDTEECLFDDVPRKGSSLPQPCYLNARSASSESMPSLESDDHSIVSVGSPSTPESLRSRRSYQNLKKDKARSLPVTEDCAFNHPLVARSDSDDDDEFLLPVQKQTPPAKARSSFKSNLTASLQNLKNAAVNSISSLGRANAAQTMSRFASPPIDDALWSHPFLFPRLSSEIRPALVTGVPSQAQRRYLNPMPLTFEEQEAPFQQALHAPFLAEMVEDAPIIQMQTYKRGRRRGGNPRRGGSPNPNSEAGRALLGADGVRQREVRENSDFLRVVVLEMNMRREGKLEQGKAKIWLPPRECSPAPGDRGRIPKRWQGVSAY